MHSAKILAETEMNQNIPAKYWQLSHFKYRYLQTQTYMQHHKTHATPQTYIDLARPQKVHVHVVGASYGEKK